ncbi:low molecular weight protein tyrosine phosphatase family protein [Pseudoxanthomonas sp.]|uniref:low molecular weight protein tyrosine phosphatase family protein n=1 Tax=Pseudoxanthomonas sp. TaxID=1871049 RepID=UPI0035AFD07A
MRRNVLFICTQNRLRSPTAEQVFAEWPGVETASAGLGNDAEVPVSPELLAWADMIFVMEKAHRNRLSAKFARHLNGKRVICLDIPDDYDFMDPMLIRLLKQKVVRFLPANVEAS